VERGRFTHPRRLTLGGEYGSVLREMHVVQAAILLVIMATWAGITSERTGDKPYLSYGYGWIWMEHRRPGACETSRSFRRFLPLDGPNCGPNYGLSYACGELFFYIYTSDYANFEAE
jgi:hypothetical protein